jgi:hypothetical protein
MDKEKAISNFLSSVGQFGQLLLVSDGEVKELFGEEVATALECLSREEQVCWHCGGRCCCEIVCELYASQFSQCPVHDFRPIACRLHFCHRFDIAGRSLVLELRDIFLGSLMAVELGDSVILRLLDSPPLAGVSPELVAATSPWVEAVRQGSLDPERATGFIWREAEKYRSAHRYDGKPAYKTK